MERRDIELFLVLAEELHFGRTGERLRVSQGRVSQTVKKIERRIGGSLFERTSRRVALTPLGQQLYDELRPSYEGVQQAITRATATALAAGDQLRIGFEAPALVDQLQPGLAPFRARYPRIDVQIREAPFADPLGFVRDRQVDVLVTLLPIDEPDLVEGPVVLTEPMVLATPARHPLAKRTSVTLEDLAAAPVLRPARPVGPYWRSGPGWLTPAGRPVRPGRQVASFQELLVAIDAGDGICPVGEHVTRAFPRPGIAFVPFVDDAPPARWGLTWPAADVRQIVRALATILV
jgi:DNA-binding transcriptional LysR family regulator